MGRSKTARWGLVVFLVCVGLSTAGLGFLREGGSISNLAHPSGDPAISEQLSIHGTGPESMLHSYCRVTVGPGPGADYSTIQAALSAQTGSPPVPVVAAGCSLLVEPGTYTGPLVLDRGLRLIAIDGDPVETIIDAGGATTAISVPGRPADFWWVTISGFTIRNATTGIDAQERFLLEDSVIESFSLVGARIDTTDGLIRRSHVDGGAFGIHVLGSSRILNTIVEGASECVRVEFGGVAAIDFSTLTDCTTGVRLQSGAASDLHLQNSIVYGHAVEDLSGVDCSSVKFSNLETSCCGGENICTDPSFVNAPVGDYHLSASSPAIDAGCAGWEPRTFPRTDLETWRTLPQRALDFDGDGNAAPDMGAHEEHGAVMEPGDIDNLRLVPAGSDVLLTWAPDSTVFGAPDGEYKIYRGQIEDLGPSAFWGDVVATTDTTFYEDDDAIPFTSKGYFYLVSGAIPANEGTLGYATASERGFLPHCEAPGEDDRNAARVH